jgi:hypothetical protein
MKTRLMPSRAALPIYTSTASFSSGSVKSNRAATSMRKDGDDIQA